MWESDLLEWGLRGGRGEVFLCNRVDFQGTRA